MGGNQSSAGGQAQENGAITTSYYELLGVDRHADDDEIKKAYRRKALELHPDRNFGKEEEATRLFAEIQTAYEVLSDPQERAWYDSHEAAILRGGSGDDEAGEVHYEHNVRVTTADDITAMMAKFHRKVNYSDSPTGFFGYLRDTFERLAREERLAAEWADLDIPDYPPFGHKDDTHEDVVRHFYSTWSSFSTCKSFAWEDKFRPSTATDRRMRRLMEKENRRFRDEGIRAFNEAVRTLVAFVRKRDPRYTPSTKTDEERQAAMREAAKAQAARQRAANAAKMEEVVPEWTKTREPEELVEDEEEEEEQEEFECVACGKVFKSERQFEAHERSKKHQKAVQALKRKMYKDNKNLHLDEDVPSSGMATPSVDGEDGEEDAGQDGEEVVEDLKHLNVNGHHEDTQNVEDKKDDVTSRDCIAEEDALQEDEPPESAEATGDEDSDYASASEIKARLTNPEPEDVDDSSALPGEKKLGKAAQKRAKKAAQEAAAGKEGLRFRCAVCGNAFSSRTRLFQHIGDFGHAAPVSAAKGGGGKKAGKGKK